MFLAKSLMKYRSVYLIAAIWAFLAFTQDLWNIYLTLGFFIELKGGFINALPEMIYPGFWGIILEIFYIIGYFRHWYWVIIVTLIFSIEQSYHILPLIPYLGDTLAGPLFWNTIFSTYFLLSFFLTNFVLFIMIFLNKYIGIKNQ